jgi:hypothetical protein
MDSERFGLGLDFKVETIMCELNPGGCMRVLQRHVAVGS